ncbi:MAG: hypothetical protein A2W00_14230 [Candidatus Eisenbacteria bacterium RBG_16_71_46]|nr:MAG: hypothetical protein A2W00_14230 [Candidatus Eisenbacteria bacterium RBG_16_71_46]OGF24426.1 MAG: hypothetical protein A2V63_03595 [Candidatus Eisenbacteria bacterium RBG_19FT_COMBO_70_11]
MDSLKADYGQVLVVDDGGFFPDDAVHRDAAWFLMDAMKVIGTDAVGIGDRDLRYGLAFLQVNAKRTGLPLLSANLFMKGSHKLALQPSVIKQVGTVKTGIFGLISDKGDLFDAKDSVTVEDPVVAAKRTVAELRKKGATVVVLLSQLGKIESEDLVTTVEGIDVVIVGRNVPLVQKGRMVKNTVAVYGAEQGQYIGRTIVSLDAKQHMATAENEVFMLGPEIPDNPDMAKLVKSFEDAFNEKLRKDEKERAAAAQARASGENSPDRYLGSEVCARCHAAEAEQWKTTAHSMAWATLVEVKKDAAPECVPCHVVGYQKPGGFVNASSTPTMSNVQCENCHGLGTGHDALGGSMPPVTEQTCRGCHTADRDPDFDLATKLPKIIHSNMSGETLRARNPRGSPMLQGHGSN